MPKPTSSFRVRKYTVVNFVNVNAPASVVQLFAVAELLVLNQY